LLAARAREDVMATSRSRNKAVVTKSTQIRMSSRTRRLYELEKRLSARLRQATQIDRQKLYGEIYSEFRNTVADDLSAPSNDLALQNQRTREQMKFLERFLYPGAVFLELGSSSCRTAIEVARRVKEVYAIDVSFSAVDKSALPSNLHRLHFDGLHLPVSPASIDIAYSHQVIEHVHPEDAIDQLAEIYEALAPGGKFICVTPNRLNGPHDESRMFDEVATGLHLKEYTITELGRLLRKSGFSQVVAYTGGRGCYIGCPQVALKLFEAAFSLLPWNWRTSLGRHFPLRPLLAIRLVGWKL
jgi:SAM-dependent methyltransferase